MKKKPIVFFKPIEGSAPLFITWFKGPKGDAVEANNSIGVGFFSPNGEILGVIFDDVQEKSDKQILNFNHYQIELKVLNKKISYKLIELKKDRNLEID